MLRILLKFWIACIVSIWIHSAYAEQATAIDTSEETVVLGKILQPPAPRQDTTANQDQVLDSAQINNDIDEAQTRDLPALNQPIIDQANLLSQSQRQHLSDQLIGLNKTGKAQIGVIIVPTTGAEDIFSFAMRVADQWQLGSSKRDNGILMAIAVNDHRIQILTGYGLEGILPDIIVSRIINQKITPEFKQGDYASGIEAGLNEIERIIQLDPEIAAQAAQDLKEKQQQALAEQQARQKTLNTALFILIAGIVGSYIVGRRLSASTAGVAALVAGLVNGAGIVTSLLLGFGIFILLITSIAQLIFNGLLSGGGRGGGGGFGGGGYRGGGGGFGGGGASGSW